jgi:hypothetical protein
MTPIQVECAHSLQTQGLTNTAARKGKQGILATHILPGDLGLLILGKLFAPCKVQVKMQDMYIVRTPIGWNRHCMAF